MSRALQRRENIAGYLFMLPCLIFFIGFVVIPMIICILTSLTDTNMHDPGLIGGSFIGLDNFVRLWGDKDFLAALKNTFVIVIVSVPTVCAFSLWVSSAIYKMKGPVLSAFRCPWSPARWPSPWSGPGCTTTITVSSTTCSRDWV